MNFYPCHIGDYAKATAWLDCYEDLFHRRLLDLYYSREQPPPADVAAVCRMVRAHTPEHKEAVERVLAEYFTLGETGWTQKRCEEELASATLKRSLAAGSASKRWQKEGARTEGARTEGVKAEGVKAEDGKVLPAEAGVGVEFAPLMRSHDPGNANALPTHSERIADALPPHSERIAPTPNPNPNPNPTPNSGSAAPPGATPATPVPDPPAGVGDWHNFFRREGFDPAAMLGSTKLRGALGAWVARGVGQALVREAMQIAHHRLGCRPNLPSYYIDIVADLLAARAPRQPAAAQRQAAPAMAQRQVAPATARPVIEDL